MAERSTKRALQKSFGPRPAAVVEVDPNMNFEPDFDKEILTTGKGPLMERLFRDLMTVSKPYNWQ